MQISPNELCKLMAEVERRTTEVFLEKERAKVKPKHNFIKIGVAYDFYDIENECSTQSFNIIIVKEGTNAVKVVMNTLGEYYATHDIHLEFDPARNIYIGYKVTKSEGKIRVFDIINIHDWVMERIEL